MTVKNIIRLLEALKKAQKKRYRATVADLSKHNTACAYEQGRLDQLEKLLEMLK